MGNNNKTICPHCNLEITNEKQNFCPYCGKSLKNQVKTNSEFQAAVNTADTVKNNGIISSVKSDLSNSKTLHLIKDSAQNTIANAKSADASKKKKIIIGVAIAALLLILVTVICNIHKCDECDKVYIGKKYEISFFDEKEDVCKDCYTDFYSFNFGR